MKKLVLLSFIVLGFVFTSFEFSQYGFAQYGALGELQSATRSIADNVLPSVVQVDVVGEVQVNRQRNFFFFFGNPFGDDEEEPQEEQRQTSQGSGVIVQRDGDNYYVLTNAHVVSDSKDVSVTTNDGNSYQAELVGIDRGRDLAVLSVISDQSLPVATLGDSDSIEQGDIVFAIGNPFGFQFSITFGIVSALNRPSRSRVLSGQLTNYIQTDAAVNTGNSGGPLININGEVVGINTWIYSRSGGNNGLSFAIPINNAKLALSEIIQKGKVEYGWLGVNIVDTRAAEVGSLIEDEDQMGVLVTSVYLDAPAAKAGILPGDVIVSIEDNAISSSNELINTIAGTAPGERTRVGVMREKTKSFSYAVYLEKRNEDEEISSSAKKLWPGARFMDITKTIKDRLDLSTDKGVLISEVVPSSPSAVAGLRRGDVIERVNNKRVSDLRDFYSEFNSVASKDEVLFRIRRNGSTLVVGLVKDSK